MSVLVRLSVSGMTADVYDTVSEHLTPGLLAAPGFVVHVAFTGDDAFHVSEIWESREDFQNWFDTSVKPNVPGVEIDLVKEVHNVIIKK
ncbi:MAG: antibiotic biosynthesis monooxygenase [Acidimicrobiales bacterium]